MAEEGRNDRPIRFISLDKITHETCFGRENESAIKIDGEKLDSLLFCVYAHARGWAKCNASLPKVDRLAIKK